MFNLTVRSSLKEYSLQFIEDYQASLKDELRSGDIIFIDENVFNIYKKQLQNLIIDNKYLIITANEYQKSFQQLNNIIKFLITSGFKRENRLIAIGGGVIQDITSFIASIYFRGVKWFFYPTTLLAQCDSCIGGKTSINFENFKNQLGNFYPPEKIFIDFNYIKSLPEEQIISGLGEMCHYYLVSGYENYTLFKSEYYNATQLKEKSLCQLISKSLLIKKEFIEKDEFDRNERQILNYGHSFGHALECITDYKLAHGIAVSYGMDVSNFISMKLGFISDNTYRDIHQLLFQIYKKYPINNFHLDDYLNILKHDKKNTDKNLNVILTKGLGYMFKFKLDINLNFINNLNEYFSTQIN